MTTDIYYKKTIPYKYGGQTLQFRVSQDLFSSFQIDLGTQFLIRTMTLGQPFPYKKILDLGCGYGPLGITLQALYPAAVVHLVDKDALALDYARQNTDLNHLTNTRVFASLGYANLTDNDYDLIVSNIPAKAGEPVIRRLLEDAVPYLAPGGSVAVVVINPLAPFVSQILTANPNIEITTQKSRPGHTVFRYRFKQSHLGEKSPSADIYLRERQSLNRDDISYKLDVAYGLDEDEDYLNAVGTLMQGLDDVPFKKYSRLLIFHPGAGQIPVYLHHFFQPEAITLADRDLLALHYTRQNLLLNGRQNETIHASHRVGFIARETEKFDFIAGILREEEGAAPVAAAVTALGASLAPGGVMILGGTATGITRVAQTLAGVVHLNESARRKYRGFGAIVYESE